MAAYVITQRLLKPRDDRDMAQYPPLARPVIERFGGRFLLASDQVEQWEGEGPCPVRVTIIEFPTLEQARNWYESPEYKEAAKIRHRNTKSRMVVASDPVAIG